MHVDTIATHCTFRGISQSPCEGARVSCLHACFWDVSVPTSNHLLACRMRVFETALLLSACSILGAAAQSLEEGGDLTTGGRPGGSGSSYGPGGGSGSISGGGGGGEHAALTTSLDARSAGWSCYRCLCMHTCCIAGPPWLPYALGTVPCAALPPRHSTAGRLWPAADQPVSSGCAVNGCSGLGNNLFKGSCSSFVNYLTSKADTAISESNTQFAATVAAAPQPSDTCALNVPGFRDCMQIRDLT